ncbi:MAG: acyltransferase [Myxococcota bacterium]
MHDAPASERLHGLDTLRALAIVLVFLYHYRVFVTQSDTFGVLGEIGWVGVDLFFALSGYLIGNQIFAAARRGGGGFSLPRFYARRALRTLPNYYVVLALYFLWPWFRGTSELLPLWKFLTFTQNYLLGPGTAFSHAWSLCIEEQFYLVLPAVALAIARIRRPLVWGWGAIAATLVGGLLIRAYLWNTHVDSNPDAGVNYYRYIYYSSFCRADELVAGVALALLKNHHVALWQRLTARGDRTLLLGLGATGVTFAMWLADSPSLGTTLFGYPMLAVSFALLILAAVSERSLLRRTRVPGAASLALGAYAIYLTHKQVCILAGGALRQAGVAPDSFGAIALLTALSVAAGWLLYRAVEAPFMALRARYVPSNSTAPLVGVEQWRATRT